MSRVSKGIVVKVTKPYEDCPEYVLVTTVYDNGSVTGFNYMGNDDWTRYKVEHGDYIISSTYNEDIL